MSVGIIFIIRLTQTNKPKDDNTSEYEWIIVNKLKFTAGSSAAHSGHPSLIFVAKYWTCLVKFVL